MTNSKAAPFFSDTSSGYIWANSAEDAMRQVMKNYSHPAGLFALNIYADADAYHKKQPPLAIWRSEEAAKQEQ